MDHLKIRILYVGGYQINLGKLILVKTIWMEFLVGNRFLKVYNKKRLFKLIKMSKKELKKIENMLCPSEFKEAGRFYLHLNTFHTNQLGQLT